MSLLDVIGDFATGDYLVTRTAKGNHVAGRYVPGATSTFVVRQACVQPSTGRDLKVLVEAGVTTEARVIFSDVELHTRTPSTDPDQVTIDGEQWAVFHVKAWQTPDERFWRALIARQSLQ